MNTNKNEEMGWPCVLAYVFEYLEYARMYSWVSLPLVCYLKVVEVEYFHQLLKSFVDCNVTPWWQGYENLASLFWRRRSYVNNAC